ncbi:MAG: MATE family efflux transporter [Candidatus Bruticola sp.]
MHNELIDGPINKALIKLTIPILGSMFLSTLFSLVDAMWVGHSGVLALASVNIASFTVWIMVALSGIITTGTNSVIANKLGEASVRPKAAEEALEGIQLSLGAAVLTGILEFLVIYFGGRELLFWMVGDKENVSAVVDIGYSYLGMLAVFAPTVCLNECISAVMRAYGDTRTPLKIYSIGFLINFVLDPIFIFGFGMIPKLGALGAAMASDISFFVVCLLLIAKIVRPGYLFQLPGTRPSFNWQYLIRIVVVGLPLSVASIVFSVVYMSIAPIISSFGPEAMAALGIGHRMESLNYTIRSGIALACITIIGQNLGAGRVDRAKRAAWVAIGWALCVSFTVCFIFVAWPELCASLFSSDKSVIAAASNYLSIIAWSQPFAAVCGIAEGAFAGGRCTWPPMCVSIPCSLLRIPACYTMVLTFGCGISSIWWSLSLLTMLRGGIVFVMFCMGLWLSKEIKDKMSIGSSTEVENG